MEDKILKGRVEIMSRFTNHIPTHETIHKMSEIRCKVRDLAYLIQDFCPESREKATALTQLSFVMMSANSAIVQVDPINTNELSELENGIFKGEVKSDIEVIFKS